MSARSRAWPWWSDRRVWTPEKPMPHEPLDWYFPLEPPAHVCGDPDCWCLGREPANPDYLPFAMPRSLVDEPQEYCGGLRTLIEKPGDYVWGISPATYPILVRGRLPTWLL